MIRVRERRMGGRVEVGQTAINPGPLDLEQGGHWPRGLVLASKDKPIMDEVEQGVPKSSKISRYNSFWKFFNLAIDNQASI